MSCGVETDAANLRAWGWECPLHRSCRNPEIETPQLEVTPHRSGRNQPNRDYLHHFCDVTNGLSRLFRRRSGPPQPNSTRNGRVRRQPFEAEFRGHCFEVQCKVRWSVEPGAIRRHRSSALTPRFVPVTMSSRHRAPGVQRCNEIVQRRVATSGLFQWLTAHSPSSVTRAVDERR